MIPGELPATFKPELDSTPDSIYDYYMRFREPGRIARMEPDWPLGEPGLVLLRLDDVQAGLRDGRLGREVHRLLPPDRMPPPVEPNSFAEVHANWMLFRDPPDHTRLRSTAKASSRSAS